MPATSVLSRLKAVRQQYQRRTYARRQAERARTPPTPPGVPCGPPDYVGLGAQKAGTTWWFRLLIQHPGVERPASWFKEVNFFERYWETPLTVADIDLYHRHFPTRPGRLSGEWTPEYLFDPWAVASLGRAAPDARLLVILRDPVARYQSGMSHERATGRKLNIDDARHAFQRGLYLEQLRNVCAHFPREQLLVLQYERCCSDPAGELARTFRHLGLDPAFVPPDLTRHYNATEGPKIELGEQLAATLARAYRDPSRALAAEFPEIDLTLWPSVRD